MSTAAIGTELVTHRRTVRAAIAALLVFGSCTNAPAFDDPEAICPAFEEARDAREADTDRDATAQAVERLLVVMPEQFHDEIALWYYPVGGPVRGLDRSGIAAMEAGELLDDLYAANC